MRELPPLSAFTDEIARALRAQGARGLASGAYPATTLLFGSSHLLLVRDHQHSVTLSLPHDQSWAAVSRVDWHIALPQIDVAIGAYRRAHPQIVTMADVILALAPVLLDLSGRPWEVSFPGTPVPSEAWMKDGERNVGVFQEDDTVRVVVWVNDEHRAEQVTSQEQLAPLARWIETNVADQSRDLLETAEKEKPDADRPRPTLEEVMRGLQSGKRYQMGAGRWYQAYTLVGDELHCETFDEGYTDDRVATIQELADDIKRYPDDFHRPR